MSVLERPERAPCMRRVNCESLEGAYKILCQADDDVQESSGIATLSIRDPVSLLDGKEQTQFSAFMGELISRRVAVSDLVLKIRKNALKGNGRSMMLQDSSATDKKAENTIALRHLHISTCKLSTKDLQKLILYTRGNAALSTLSLKVNEIVVSNFVSDRYMSFIFTK